MFIFVSLKCSLYFVTDRIRPKLDDLVIVKANFVASIKSVYNVNLFSSCHWSEIATVGCLGLGLVLTLSHLTVPSPIDKYFIITNWVKLESTQHHRKVLLNSFPLNGHTLGCCP